MPQLVIRVQLKGVKVHPQCTREQDGILYCVCVEWYYAALDLTLPVVQVHMRLYAVQTDITADSM